MGNDQTVPRAGNTVSDDEVATFAATIRKDALALLHFAESGHPGGVLSCADVVAVLWLTQLGYQSPEWSDPGRNRLVLSKGHSVAVLYAAAGRSGLLPPHLSTTLRAIDSPLQGHSHVIDTPWVETSTGSLGQGFSAAVGMALGLLHQKIDAQVFVILGDGELQEGQVWEAAMCSAHYQLGNLCAIVDHNGLQSDDRNENIMGIEPLADKWRSFGWDVHEVDGHDIAELRSAITAAGMVVERPSVLIARTVKGKGVSFMEDVPEWHGSVAIKDEELRSALRELGASDDDVEAYLSGDFWHE